MFRPAHSTLNPPLEKARQALASLFYGGAATTKACISCSEDLPLSDFSSSELTTSCNHSNNACTACVKQWIETKVADGSWDQITCLECDERMQYADIQRHADPQVFERYDLLTTRSWLNNETDFVWCRNSECGSGHVHEGGPNTPIFQCNACEERFCVVHEVPWHQDETCEAFDRRMSGQDPVQQGGAGVDGTEQYAQWPWTEHEEASPRVFRGHHRRLERLLHEEDKSWIWHRAVRCYCINVFWISQIERSLFNSEDQPV